MKMPDLALERDIVLDSFRAIGKFLYNKRETSSSQVRSLATTPPQPMALCLPLRDVGIQRDNVQQ